MTINKYDYVEITYTARLKSDGTIFDTTDEDIAKQHNIHNPKAKYKPVIICVGEQHVVTGLDNALVGKDVGKFTVEVADKDAFGKKNAKLLKLMPMKLFTQQEIKPFPGLDVNVDGELGIVKSVSAGRVIVDFNHPLASHDVVYDVEIRRVLEDKVEKAKALLEMFGMPYDSVSIEDDKLIVKVKQELPKPISDVVIKNIIKTVKVAEVEFKNRAVESTAL